MSEFLEKVTKTLAHHERITVRALRELRWQIGRPHIHRPVFVIGCSRAGTTVVYKTFSEASELGSLQRETHDFWSELHPPQERNWDTHGLTASGASDEDREIVSRYFYVMTGATRFVDKNNQNGLCVPYLYSLFPDSQFVYVKRSPGDNIHSLIEGWGKADEFATWSGDLPVEVSIDGGKYTRWCFFLFDGWRDYVHRPIEDVCAAQYVAMNSAILSARQAIPPSQWTEIVYEELVRDPVQVFRNAFKSCGLQFSPRVETHCGNVLANPYNAFSEIKLDKWREQRNRGRIERVMPIVERTAVAMGYEL